MTFKDCALASVIGITLAVLLVFGLTGELQDFVRSMRV